MQDGASPVGRLNVVRLGTGPRVVLVHGSMSRGTGTFGRQQPLADRFTLEIVDRRGFGASPARPGGVDFEADADDVLALLDGGAHLVGHSYGAVVSLVATARDPGRVRSLTVIEPPAFALGSGRPAVDSVVARLRPVFPAAPDADPGTWYASFLRALGFDVPDRLEIAPEDLADVRASMTERVPGDAWIDLDAIRSAGVPALVVRGDWSTAPTAAPVGGAAFAEVCQVVADRLTGRLVVIPRSTHNPQVSRPELFNAVLAEFIEAHEPAPSRTQPGEAS